MLSTFHFVAGPVLEGVRRCAAGGSLTPAELTIVLHICGIAALALLSRVFPTRKASTSTPTTARDDSGAATLTTLISGLTLIGLVAGYWHEARTSGPFEELFFSQRESWWRWLFRLSLHLFYLHKCLDFCRTIWELVHHKKMSDVHRLVTLSYVCHGMPVTLGSKVLFAIVDTAVHLFTNLRSTRHASRARAVFVYLAPFVLVPALVYSALVRLAAGVRLHDVLFAELFGIVALSMQRKAEESPARHHPLAHGGSKRVITKEELWARPDWIGVSGGVYDLAAFAPSHPGGEMIRAMGGVDCTAVFFSMHSRTAHRNLQALDKYRVGSLAADPAAPALDFDSEFATELKAKVHARLGARSPYAPRGFWVRSVLVMAAVVLAEAMWIATGSLVAMVAVGLLHVLVGTVMQHDGSHGGVSANPSINAFFAYGADWIGTNRWLWLQQHVIGHHPHTNEAHSDPDAHSAEPLLVFHLFPPSVRRWVHQYQWLYMWLVLPWYAATVIYNPSSLYSLDHAGETPRNRWVLAKRPTAVAFRLAYIARIVIGPWVIGGASLLVTALGVPLIVGTILTTLFIVSHNFMGADRFPLEKKGSKKVDWYRMQVETGCTYGGRIAGLLTGGLNYQIEHHLFPRLSSWHYPLISPVVREVCARHGVSYTQFPTLFHNLASTIRYMRLAGSMKPAALQQTTQEKKDAVLASLQAGKFAASQSYCAADSLRAQSGPLPIVIHGQTYDAREWLPFHPGGDIILHYVGRDATDVFTAMHDPRSLARVRALPKLAPLEGAAGSASVFIGKKFGAQQQEDLAVSDDQRVILEDFRALRAEFEKEGLMQPSLLWYLYKTVSTVALGAVALLWLSYGPAGLLSGLLSGILFGLCLQQLGWVGHEYAHHCVFSTRPFNRMCSYLLGNLTQGLSVLWWKTRHNEHHATTNVLEHDPDIDNLPIFAWSTEDVSRAVQKRGPRTLSILRYQAWYYLPMTSLLRFIWLLQSILCVAKMPSNTNAFYRGSFPIELITLLGHYAYRAAALYLLSPSFGTGLFHFVASELTGGLGMALVVFANHFPMPKHRDAVLKCWPVVHIEGTYNIAAGAWNDWLCGGLNYQIEHHLFPSMPRHNFSVVAPRVKAFCARHNLPYRAPGLLAAIGHTMRWLDKMGKLLPAARAAAAARRRETACSADG